MSVARTEGRGTLPRPLAVLLSLLAGGTVLLALGLTMLLGPAGCLSGLGPGMMVLGVVGLIGYEIGTSRDG